MKVRKDTRFIADGAAGLALRNGLADRAAVSDRGPNFGDSIASVRSPWRGRTSADLTVVPAKTYTIDSNAGRVTVTMDMDPMHGGATPIAHAASVPDHVPVIATGGTKMVVAMANIVVPETMMIEARGCVPRWAETSTDFPKSHRTRSTSRPVWRI